MTASFASRPAVTTPVYRPSVQPRRADRGPRPQFVAATYRPAAPVMRSVQMSISVAVPVASRVPAGFTKVERPKPIQATWQTQALFWFVVVALAVMSIAVGLFATSSMRITGEVQQGPSQVELFQTK